MQVLNWVSKGNSVIFHRWRRRSEERWSSNERRATKWRFTFGTKRRRRNKWCFRWRKSRRREWRRNEWPKWRRNEWPTRRRCARRRGRRGTRWREWWEKRRWGKWFTTKSRYAQINFSSQSLIYFKPLCSCSFLPISLNSFHCYWMKVYSRRIFLKEMKNSSLSLPSIST